MKRENVINQAIKLGVKEFNVSLYSSLYRNNKEYIEEYIDSIKARNLCEGVLKRACKQYAKENGIYLLENTNDLSEIEITFYQFFDISILDIIIESEKNEKQRSINNK